MDIIKGPSSVTIGFLEPGGVVDYVTKHPLPQPTGDYSLMSSTHGTVRATGDVNVPLTSRLFLRGTGALEHRGSWRDYVSTGVNAAGLALDYTASPSTLLESRFYNTYLSGVPDPAVLPRTP